MERTLTIAQLNAILDRLDCSDADTWIAVFIHAGNAYRGTALESMALDACTAWARRYCDRDERADRQRELNAWRAHGRTSSPAGALVNMGYRAGLSKADLFGKRQGGRLKGDSPEYF